MRMTNKDLFRLKSFILDFDLNVTSKNRTVPRLYRSSLQRYGGHKR